MGGGFVEKNRPWGADQRHRQGDPLSLARRQSGDPPLFELVDAEQVSHETGERRTPVQPRGGPDLVLRCGEEELGLRSVEAGRNEGCSLRGVEVSDRLSVEKNPTFDFTGTVPRHQPCDGVQQS
jgi:hypothetical protein